jgi:hypothetical protein
VNAFLGIALLVFAFFFSLGAFFFACTAASSADKRVKAGAVALAALTVLFIAVLAAAGWRLA